MATSRLQMEGDDSVLLHVTHSNLKSFAADVRFSPQMNVEAVKEKLWKKCGTSVNAKALELYDESGSNVAALTDDSRPLGFYSPFDGSLKKSICTEGDADSRSSMIQLLKRRGTSSVH